ncbi:MAG: threonine synthase [Sphingobacteriales bacterium]|uniref:threonine synthase n=1 Tax=Hydrotalea flava TaxID=714549 RepID=UPI000837156A|nr:threonine synthase [Hydrotalea flava]RTL55032.1 MAG: threonine synthase [Sphingobacteriales bacterium]
MKYFSLNHKAPVVDFSVAAIQGQAPDKGLYFPENIPALPKGFIENIQNYTKTEIGVTVMQPYVGNAMPLSILEKIIEETVGFPFPLVTITPSIAALELFHGPTLAFKDVGARFMSRCLAYFNRNNTQPVTVLVATSGDTGGAVAHGFLGVKGVEVIILYPKNKVSKVQELQLTTPGNNITALEIEGNFDDCQAMVKEAFMDKDLNRKLTLTSANSINVARWLPQQLYYFFAYQQWQQQTPPVISVPSGNFGNIGAAILAHHSGLPVQHFIAACNANKVVTNYLSTGTYQAQHSVPTFSNAMDVGNPSNFIRILEIFQHSFQSLKNKISSFSIDDATTIQTIQTVYQQYNYLLDPHGAVAFAALSRYLQQFPNLQGYIAATAHPVKFPDVVKTATGYEVPIPEAIEELFTKEKTSMNMPANFNALKEWLLNRKHF